MMDKNEIKEMIKESIEEVFFSDEEYSPFNSLQDKINGLLSIQEAEEKVSIAIKYADKFEDYMKNVDKLNMMINEFKGLVSIVRGQTQAVKKENDSIKKKMKKVLEALSE